MKWRSDAATTNTLCGGIEHGSPEFQRPGQEVRVRSPVCNILQSVRWTDLVGNLCEGPACSMGFSGSRPSARAQAIATTAPSLPQQTLSQPWAPHLRCWKWPSRRPSQSLRQSARSFLLVPFSSIRSLALCDVYNIADVKYRVGAVVRVVWK